MILKKSRNTSLFFFICFVLLIIPFLYKIEKKVNNVGIENEQYMPELSYLNTSAKFIAYADSIYATKQLSVFDTAQYACIVSDAMKKRFRFGLLNYDVSENWIAALSGKLLWSHMSVVVNPNDILKHSEGLCSQQTIVFMDILKKKKINVRSVGLGYPEGPGHFLCEVHYNNSWHLHDVTKEPKWKKLVNHHESMDYYLANPDSLYKAYEHIIPKNDFNKFMKKVVYGKPNEFPAKNMLFFQKTASVLTYLLPVIFLMLALYVAPKKNKAPSVPVTDPVKEEVSLSEL